MESKTVEFYDRDESINENRGTKETIIKDLK